VSIDIGKVTERSVDSLQKIYAFVIALAISAAIQALLKAPANEELLPADSVIQGLPVFVAFVVTLVPFYHGMNRHFDHCYLEKTRSVVQGALLLDFAVFFLEASLLFAVAWSLRSGLRGFVLLGVLLSVDMLWGVGSHFIHYAGEKPSILRWSVINLIAIGLAFGVLFYPTDRRPALLMLIAIFRTVADYYFCWGFYFPGSRATAKR
jgi:hypothetical protein